MRSKECRKRDEPLEFASEKSLQESLARPLQPSTRLNDTPQPIDRLSQLPMTQRDLSLRARQQVSVSHAPSRSCSRLRHLPECEYVGVELESAEQRRVEGNEVGVEGRKGGGVGKKAGEGGNREELRKGEGDADLGG